MAEGGGSSEENSGQLREQSAENSRLSCVESAQYLASNSTDDQSTRDDNETGQETEPSRELDGSAVGSAAVNSSSELISSETETPMDFAKTRAESPAQQGGDRNYTNLEAEGISSGLKETVSDAMSERMHSSRPQMETYDEITKSEVTSLDDWEDVQESCLSETPPVDPEVLKDLESRAKDIAGNLDHMLAALANSLKAMSHVSTECLGAYSACVDHMSETVDVNIRAMYTLIAKCEELNASLKPVKNMAEQIKDIKKTLDFFEAICK